MMATMAGRVAPEHNDTLRADLKGFLRTRPDVTLEQIAQFTALSGSALRHFHSGSVGLGEAMHKSVRAAIDQARAGDILAPGASNGAIALTDAQPRGKRVARAGNFYETETVKRVAETLDYCAENCAIGVITADFGVGKTEAVKAWRKRTARKVDSVSFEFCEFTAANRVETVSMIAEALGVVRPTGNANAARGFRDVCAYLRENPALLIFDQCEAVRPRVLQVLRQIWDRTADAGVGLTLLGAPILLQRMLSGTRADLGALTSRVGVWAPLAGISRDEMASVIKQEGVTDVEDAAFDLWYRATQGSMRRLMRSMDLIKSKHAGRRVTGKTITGVAGHLFGMAL
jgi:DNA transposition AAA+ family ATPase